MIINRNRYKLKIFDLSNFEFGFSVFFLVHISQAITPLILTQGVNEGDNINLDAFDLSLNAKMSLIFYLVTFVLLAIRWKKNLAVFWSNQLFYILMAVVCFSYFWSINPEQTLKYSFYALSTSGFGLYMATRYTLQQQIKILTWTYGLLLILSILFAIAIPEYGFMGGIHQGALRGVFTHKNQFGAFMAPSGVIFFLNAIVRQQSSWVYWCLLTLSCITIVMSQSITAVATFMVMLLFCIIYRIFRWRYEVMLSAILALIIVSAIALIVFTGLGSDSLFNLIGRETTLSGRTDIWRYVWDQIQARFWLGYGLAAFWNGYDGPSGYIQLAMKTTIIYAHNGFLELWLASGLLGLSLFMIGFVNSILQSLILLRRIHTPEAFWPLSFLTYILLSNLTEGTIATMNSSFWAIYAATSYSLVIAKNNNYVIYK